MISPDAVDQQIDAAIAAALDMYGPMVVRITYRYGNDWSGDRSVFFNVLLAAGFPECRQTVHDLYLKLADECGIGQTGLHVYSNFRTVAEQAARRDPEWE